MAAGVFTAGVVGVVSARYPEVSVPAFMAKEAFDPRTQQAAERTCVPSRLTAFARLRANAAGDGSTVDTDGVLVGILARLEEPHMRLLNLLDRTPTRV